jgi:hypothetical protein
MRDFFKTKTMEKEKFNTVIDGMPVLVEGFIFEHRTSDGIPFKMGVFENQEGWDVILLSHGASVLQDKQPTRKKAISELKRVAGKLTPLQWTVHIMNLEKEHPEIKFPVN